MTRLLIATNNHGKQLEYLQLLARLNIELCTLADLSLSLVISEDGSSYAENARTKAHGYAKASGLLALADDSGLEVDALGGTPGLHSARYAGPGASDWDRCYLLLARLAGVPWEERTARFRCVIAIATPDGDAVSTEGTCEGMVALEPKGQHGFGYDPIFWFPEDGQTMAELPTEVKNLVSHRARAVQRMLPALALLLARVQPAEQAIRGA